VGFGLATSASTGLLNYYDTGNFTASFSTGMYTTPTNVLVQYCRIGNVVHLAFPDARVTANATATTWGAVAGQFPASIRPSTSRVVSIVTQYSNVGESGFISINADGAAYLYRSGQVNFASGTENCGFYYQTCSYLVNN
jgi:hypothetical protein